MQRVRQDPMIRRIRANTHLSSSSVAERHYQPTRKRVAFSGTTADWLFKNLPAPVNTRVGNLSLEDFSARLSVWTFYIPQGIMAIRTRQHPFETWGRNILAWFGVLGITLLGKHEKYGFNRWFNNLMLPKERLAPLPTSTPQFFGHVLRHPLKTLKYMVNDTRMEMNYLALAKKAGVRLREIGIKSDELDKAIVKDAVWTKLDVNELFKVLEYAKRLKTKAAKSNNEHIKRFLTKRAQMAEGMVKRVSLCKYLAFAASTVLFTVTIGVMLQRAVFLFIAPLDRKFVPNVKVKLNTFDNQDDKNSGSRFSGANHSHRGGWNR